MAKQDHFSKDRTHGVHVHRDVAGRLSVRSASPPGCGRARKQCALGPALPLLGANDEDVQDVR